MADVKGASAAPVDDKKRDQGVQFDFSFGFLNAQFSDCSLVLTSLLSPDEKQELEVLPVSSLVLASKSDYFKTHFAGGFNESVKKRRVEIGINPTERLKLLMEKAEHTVALEFLDLDHEHIPELRYLAITSEAKFVLKFIPLLNVPKHPSVMALPLSGVAVLARSNGLQVDSEDVMAERIMEWIEVNAPGKKSLDLYVQVLWKHVRICRLSLVSITAVVHNTLRAMDSSGLGTELVSDSLRLALCCHSGFCERDSAIQLATLCATKLSQMGLMSTHEAVGFTSIWRNWRRA